MVEKVRYEERDFFHYIYPTEDTNTAFSALEDLEKICSDLGGVNLGRGTEEVFDGCHVMVNYVVAKKNGAVAFVKMEIEGTKKDCIRSTTVVNVEKYEHKELLAALYAFYDGMPGPEYGITPRPKIMECEIKA